MATFEQVIHEVHEKDLRDRSVEELSELLIRLRKVRTDIPETKQRRRKRKSVDNLTKQVEEVAKKLNKPVDEIMTLLLADDSIADVVKSVAEGGADEED